MRFNSLALAALTATLISCGSAEVDGSTDKAEKTKSVKAAKFKGSKFAPPQGIMNVLAGQAMVVQKGSGYMLPGRCYKIDRSVDKGNYDDITPECLAELISFSEKSVFNVIECRKGDERDNGYTDKLFNPVSCDGDVDTPKGSAKVLMIFNKPQDAWLSEVGAIYAGSWKEH